MTEGSKLADLTYAHTLTIESTHKYKAICSRLADFFTYNALFLDYMNIGLSTSLVLSDTVS